jgi:hypothetical protein
LSNTSTPFCSSMFGRWGLTNYLPGLAFNFDAPELSLPSSKDYYMCEPLALRLVINLSISNWIKLN